MKRIYNKYGLWVMFFASAFLLSASIFFFAKRNKWLDEEFAYQLSLQHISDKLVTINLLVKNTESGVRGYAATGNREFVTGFEKNINHLEEETRLLITEKEKQGMEPFSQMLFTLDSLVEKRIELLQEIKALAETNQAAAVRLIRTGPGLKLSGSISHTIDLLNAEAGSKIKTSREAFLYTNYRNNINAYISLSGSLLLILFSFYFLFKEINWRKRISHELNFQKERFRITLKSIHDGLISTDMEGRIIFMNPTAERLTGWSWREAKNQPLQKIYNVVHEESGAIIDDLLDSILKEGKTSEWENNTTLHSKFNEKFVISKSAAPVLNENEKVEGAVFVFNDITEKKKLENKIKENEMLLRSIIQTSPECVKLLGINGELMEMNRAGLAMIEADDLQQVKGTSVYGIVCEPYRQEFARLTKDAFAGKSGIQEFEIVGLKGTRRWLETHAVPLKNAEETIVSMLGISRDITQRKKSEQTLKESEEKYRNLVEQAADSILIFDLHGNFISVNSSGCETLGYDKETLLTLNLSDITPDKYKGKLPVNITDLLAGKTVLAEREFKRSDGSVFFTEVRAQLTPDKNILAIVRDISDRKKAEKKLKQLSQAVEQSPASVIITDIYGNIEYVNKQFTKVTGYSAAEVLGTNPRLLKSGYTSTEEYNKLWETISSGKEWRCEFCNKKKSGELYWESALISPILNEKNEINGYLAIKEDITEKKKAAEELLNSKKQFQSLVENISGVYWVNNLEPFQTLYISPSYETIWGRKCEDLYSNPQDFINTIHPEDKPVITEAFKNLSDTLKADVTYRIIKPNGSIRWISTKTKVVVDSKGNKMEYGYAEDITERMQAETALKESEETFRRLYNETADPVLLLDENGFVDCNHSAVFILGYNSKEEVINKTPWDISPEKQPDGKLSIDKAKAMISKALEIGYNRFEWIHTKSDGTAFPVEVMLTPILLKGKQIFYTLWRDITERKKAEHEKQLALERYDILSRATSDTIWDWDMVNNTMLYNEGITNMFGYQSSDVKNVTDWWNDKLHKDDFEKVAASLNEIFENKQKYFQLTYRFRCADGSYKYIFDRAFVLFDDEGVPYRMIGSMQDITYRKEEDVRIGRVAIEAQERERLQIGMELHDNVKQILSATLLYLGMANDKNRSKKEVAEYIEMCHGFILDSIKEIRQLSHRLAPSSFENISMKEVIDLLIQNMNPENKWKVKLHIDEKDLDGINSDLKVNLYRILQEQLSNVIKYADAGKVEVEIKIADNYILLRIFDNGKGFDTSKVKTGIGLENIRRRTEVFSGELFINSSVGKGCELVVKLPLKSGGS